VKWDIRSTVLTSKIAGTVIFSCSSCDLLSIPYMGLQPTSSAWSMPKPERNLATSHLRVGSTPHIERYAGHLGFSVHEAHRGHRYAARSVALLGPIAKEMGFASLWITCNPENMASRRTLELAGAEFIEIVDVPPDFIIFQSGHLRKCRYLLDLKKLHGVTDRNGR
jgi:predicted acetyltransferase